MSQFHSLRVADKYAETGRAVCLRLALSPDIGKAFEYSAGQHIVLRALIDGEELRRTYSICSAQANGDLTICIRSDGGGRMTRHLLDAGIGSHIDVFPPTGRFGLQKGMAGANYLAVAAGIGITPILSIVDEILATQPDARVTLLYGNRSTDSVLFAEALQGLKDRHAARLALHFFMSREQQELAIYNGRIDAQKLQFAAGRWFDPKQLDAVFICAPEIMMNEVSGALQALGLPAANLHIERFVMALNSEQRTAVADAGPKAAGHSTTNVTVRMDGRVKSFAMPRDGSLSVLDAAEGAGLDLPYSCKGGVCSTCRTFVVKGSVQMTQNYALEDSEVEAGFVLACQAVPTSAELELDYDTR